MDPAKDSIDLGVLVRDIQTSLLFYQELLGLKFKEKVPVWFGTMYRLRFGTSDFKLIDPSTQPPLGLIGLGSQLGFRYVTFVMRNLSDVCKELRSKGIGLEPALSWSGTLTEM
jgi:catechol 2,3-dioxygenase-like lactoylglutathione lyase family enzyme